MQPPASATAAHPRVGNVNCLQAHVLECLLNLRLDDDSNSAPRSGWAGFGDSINCLSSSKRIDVPCAKRTPAALDSYNFRRAQARCDCPFGDRPQQVVAAREESGLAFSPEMLRPGVLRAKLSACPSAIRDSRLSVARDASHPFTSQRCFGQGFDFDYAVSALQRTGVTWELRSSTRPLRGPA